MTQPPAGSPAEQPSAAMKKAVLRAVGRLVGLHPAVRHRHQRFAELRAARSAQTCIILGNGPSLADTDFSLLRGRSTWVVNNCSRLLDEGLVTPTYFVAQDTLFLKSAHRLLRRLDAEGTVAMLPTRAAARHPSLLRHRHVHWFGQRGRPPRNVDGLGWDPVDLAPDGVPRLYTVVVSAAVLAAALGYRRIVLLGLDLDWSMAPADELVRSNGYLRVHRAGGGPDRDHFDPGYRTAGQTYHVVPPEAHVASFAAVAPALARHGVEVVNATPVDRLRLFDACSLSAALR